MSVNAFADGMSRGLGIFQQVQGMKNQKEDRAYNRKMQKQLFDMRLEDREYGRQRDKTADERWQQTQDYRQGRDVESDARYQDGQDYRRGRDGVLDQRYQETQDYRESRDGVADTRYQDNQDYRNNRDKESDTRWQKNYNAQLGIRGLQQKNLQGQIDAKKAAATQAKRVEYARLYQAANKSGDAKAMQYAMNLYLGSLNLNPKTRSMLQQGAAPGHTKVATGFIPAQGGILPEITTYDKEGKEVSVSGLSVKRSNDPKDPFAVFNKEAVFRDFMTNPDTIKYMMEADAAIGNQSGKKRYQTLKRYDDTGMPDGEDFYYVDEARGGLVPIPVLNNNPKPEPTLPSGMEQKHIEQFIQVNPGATAQDAINAWSMR